MAANPYSVEPQANFSNFAGYSPVTISPGGDFRDIQTYVEYKPIGNMGRGGYPVAEHYTMLPPPGLRTIAGVWEINNHEFIQSRDPWKIANNQIVTVPERPVDKGTFKQYQANNSQWVTRSGVALQPINTISNIPAYGSAPTAGIYTGLSQDELVGEY